MCFPHELVICWKELYVRTAVQTHLGHRGSLMVSGFDNFLRLGLVSDFLIVEEQIFLKVIFEGISLVLELLLSTSRTLQTPTRLYLLCE